VPSLEAELHIEYLKSMAPSVPLTVIYNDDYALLTWVNKINSINDTILVHGVGYGTDESQQTSIEFMSACNTGFMKAGTRGMSLLFSAGDYGPCGRSGCGFWKFTHFHPDFPAASPYITAVGGTDFVTDDIGEEMAWTRGGGGFSDIFQVPDYQKSAVDAYKSDPAAELPPQAWWNNTGRAYPDISALGGLKTPYCVYSANMWQHQGGTSAATQVVAGIFARLNGLRLAAGKPAMGFLNPFIYANPSGFQDVTKGRTNYSLIPNNGSYGFQATKGWDAATGFGTPDFAALSNLVMNEGASYSALVV